MTYDTDKGDEKYFVNENREKFYQQNLIAINAATTVLLSKLVNEVKPKIEQTKECANGNGARCGIPSTDDGGKNEVWFTYASVLEQYDRLIKMMETVSALRARYTAIEAMKMIRPEVASEAEKRDNEQNNGNDISFNEEKTQAKKA